MPLSNSERQARWRAKLKAAAEGAVINDEAAAEDVSADALFDGWPPELLARLDQWRRFQYDRPDRSQAIQLLVRAALGMPAA